MKTNILKNYAFCLMLVGFFQQPISISWNANKESDLAGYKVYWSKQSGNYENVKDVGHDTSFTIENLLPGFQYYMAVTAYDINFNESDFSQEVSIFIDDNGSVLPTVENMATYNFPNPFNPISENTNIRYYLTNPENVSITIYDANENLIRNLVDNVQKLGGEHTEDIWDGKTNNGYLVPNGVYYALIKLGAKEEVIKIAIVR